MPSPPPPLKNGLCAHLWKIPVYAPDHVKFKVTFFQFSSRYVLNYLRNGELRYPDDKTFQEDLLSEARFFQVQGMIDQLERDILPFKPSAIIKNKKHRLALVSWLPPGATCSLLYRAAINGGTAKDFHRCCDKKGPSLVVVKSNNYIFGGYTSKSWDTRTYSVANFQ